MATPDKGDRVQLSWTPREMTGWHMILRLHVSLTGVDCKQLWQLVAGDVCMNWKIPKDYCSCTEWLTITMMSQSSPFQVKPSPVSAEHHSRLLKKMLHLYYIKIL